MVAEEKIKKVAHIIAMSFSAYREQFMIITRRAKSRFERRNWNGIQFDAQKRLELYREFMADVMVKVRNELGPETNNHEVWQRLKYTYYDMVMSRMDYELAETYYNSVTRKIFTTLGVDAEIEFTVHSDEPIMPAFAKIYNTYKNDDSIFSIIDEVLKDYSFFVDYDKRDYYVHLISNKIKERVHDEFGQTDFHRIEIIKPIFFRNKGAYVIGRIIRDADHEPSYGDEYDGIIPFALALLNPFDTGIIIDAVLLNPNEVSVVFSFTRSYFLVDMENTFELMLFLKSIMPDKRRSELYNSIGCDKHGKTVLYREIIKHLQSSDDKFTVAPGIPGMVMTVFALPSMNIVFKVIKDRFDPPKSTTRKSVMEKYKIVFMHDRVGRLADAQEFEYLVFDLDRFEPELLKHLLEVAAKIIELDGDKVIIKHVYIERKMIPLDIYINQADEEDVREAIIEYGNAIKELAAANIFPGDLLIKNFGVTRHGRVVFYDYDELCFVTDCNFKRKPVSRNDYDELSSEPWYSVEENDIFPEELESFIIPIGPLREIFLQYHKDLFSVEFWRDMQERQKKGEIIDVYPYHKVQRLNKRIIQ